MKFKFTLCVLTLLSLSMFLPAQSKEPTATLCVYRNYYHVTFGKAAPDVTANGQKLAELDEGRYFVAQIPAGFTVVTCGKKKDNRVEIDAKAGETYYMRIRAHPGMMFARFEMFRLSKEEAVKDADKLHYVKAGDIKSPMVLPETTPFPR